MKLKLLVKHDDQHKTKIDYGNQQTVNVVEPLNPIFLFQKED